jgi:hypothetical protein
MMARGTMGGGGGGAGGGFGGAAMGGMAMGAAALYAANQANRNDMKIKKDEDEEEPVNVDKEKNKIKGRNFILFMLTLFLGAYLIIQGWIESQHGMFEFIGVDASPEEYKRRVISLYEIHNAEKLEGDKHRRPVDQLFWKYRYKEKALWHKIKKKYENKAAPETPAAVDDVSSEETNAERTKEDATTAGTGNQKKTKDL